MTGVMRSRGVKISFDRSMSLEYMRTESESLDVVVIAGVSTKESIPEADGQHRYQIFRIFLQITCYNDPHA